MIATSLQIGMGVVALVVCLWAYGQAMKMAAVQRRLHVNGSTGMAVRTIKRREVLHALKCLVIIASGLYVRSWLQRRVEVTALEQVLVVRSLSVTMIAFLIALNTIWDSLDRSTSAEIRVHELERLRTQKRQSDPVPGASLPDDALHELARKDEDSS
jgi:hypothetical protein